MIIAKEDLMKKDIRIMLLFFLILSLPFANISCKKPARNVEEVLDFIKSIESYESYVEYEIKNDKKASIKKAKQYFHKDEGYRLELEQKRVYVYKEDSIEVEDIVNNAKYSLDKDFDELYRFTFIGEYIKYLYSSQDIKYFCKNLEGKNYMVVELIIPGNNRNLKTAFMYVDLTKNLPEKIVIFDERGNERVSAIYRNLDINIELDKNLFK